MQEQKTASIIKTTILPSLLHTRLFPSMIITSRRPTWWEPFEAKNSKKDKNNILFNSQSTKQNL